MSAILRLTQETLVIEKGRLKLRAPTPEAVDYYLSHGYSQEGERVWDEDEVSESAAPFRPLAVRIRSLRDNRVIDTVRSTLPFGLEIEYMLSAPVAGLRVGFYLMSTRGEYIFTSFDTDQPECFEQYGTRSPGHYISRCLVPADLLNEGRFVVGINASSFRVRRYFQDEQALNFSVDGTGAPGTHWPEPRLGPVRPRLDWNIEVKG
jgi:lipopolysaccharide transport system ATP-binding protein